MKRSKVYLSREESRRVDELAMAAGTSGITLMENAGRGCVGKLNEHDVKSAVVLCGTGNNGGDGFVIARRLAIQGATVKILVCGEPNRIFGDAKVNFEIAKNIDLIIKFVDCEWDEERIADELKSVQGQRSEWIIDCLLGTGAQGNPRPPTDTVIRIANTIEAKKLAVDVPSGLDCDTGKPGNPTFKADLTCTFVAKKKGFQSLEALPYLGTIQVVTIGVPVAILEQLDIEVD